MQLTTIIMTAILATITIAAPVATPDDSYPLCHYDLCAAALYMANFCQDNGVSGSDYLCVDTARYDEFGANLRGCAGCF